MQINKEFLKSLNPCADRYKVFLKHHGKFNGSFSEFMDLPNLDYEDKIWVAKRVLNKNQAVSWAILCAQSVVPVFEKEYPDDKRIRDCINFLKSIDDFNNLTYIERSEIEKHFDISADIVSEYACDYAVNCAATHAFYYVVHAAHYVVTSVTASAAYVAGAEYAALAARYAAHAALAANAVRSASNSINDDAWQNQQALNLQFLRMASSL